MISGWFKNYARFGFFHQLLLEVSRVRKQKKSMISGQFCFFSSFSSFSKSRNRLKQMFLTNYPYF